ncbi:hypothetical protein M9Y10_011112 [Tritrichomonas musculus]|uniref:Uncharacterized protein n=1 Tax=Tritrichomonas musculus TaxID=1915356 RepID=A0ABR2ING5_9EUKA
MNKSDLPILLAFFGFAVTFFESYCSRRLHLFNQLTDKFVTIDGDHYEPSINKDYVYYHTDNMKYPTVKDPLFQLSHECGELERKVQYCQWVQVTHTKTREVGNDTITEYYYTYHKQWLYHQVSSVFYHDPIYWNPSVQTIPQLSFRGSDIQAGAYSIDPNMSLTGSKDYFYPDGYQIRNFEESGSLPDFKYAGKGIFYSSYERGFLDQLIRVAQFFDLKGDLIDWCTPGDRRVWFESWEPFDATVVGARTQQSIKPFSYHNYKIGSVHSGEVPLKKAIMDNASGFPTVMKWIFRVAIIIYFFYSFSENSPDFFGVEILILCAILGKFIPYSLNSNIWYNILLSAFGSLCVFFLKQQETQLFRSISRNFDNNFKYKED